MEKQCVTYSVCVSVAFLIEHVTCMGPYCHVSCPALQFFSALYHKLQDFRRKIKVIEHKMCVLIYCIILVWNIFHSTKKWERCDHKCTSVFMWGKGKAVPLQVWTGPEGSRKCKVVVSLTHRPLFTPRKYSRYSFLLEAESTPGHSAIGRILCQWKIHWHQLGSNQRPSGL